MRFRLLACMVSACAVFAPQITAAQQADEGLLDLELPLSYNRGRNLSVLDRKRPEYEPLGIKLGGFTLTPSSLVAAGYTNNVYQTELDRREDVFINFRPRALLTSDWSVHAVRLDAGANIVRYLSNSVRNQDGWYLSGSGTYEFTPEASLSLSARTARQYESRFASTSIPDARELTSLQSSSARLLGKVVLSRSRILAAATYNRLNYNSVALFSGGTLDQNNRDRDIVAGTLHYEYGITPETGVYAETSYSTVNYDLPLAVGIENRDSNQVKVLAGVSFDLQALLRGNVSAGYVRRSFDAGRYRDISGVSVAARLEYFPTELTTVTLGVRREIEDANLVESSGYFTNVASLRVDHELLYNLLLNLDAQYQRDKYVGLKGTVRIFRLGGGARYMLSNSVGLTGDVHYVSRASSVAALSADLSETRGTIGVIVQR